MAYLVPAPHVAELAKALADGPHPISALYAATVFVEANKATADHVLPGYDDLVTTELLKPRAVTDPVWLLKMLDCFEHQCVAIARPSEVRALLDQLHGIIRADRMELPEVDAYGVSQPAGYDAAPCWPYRGTVALDALRLIHTVAERWLSGTVEGTEHSAAEIHEIAKRAIAAVEASR